MPRAILIATWTLLPMRYIAALYDAPFPARCAMRALAAAGVAPGDTSVTPGLPGSGPRPAAGFGRLPQDDSERLARSLTELGIARQDARAYAEGVRRGGILVLVRSPDLLPSAAAAALESAAPPDLDTHRSRWAADPNLRYEWALAPLSEASPEA